MRSRLDAQLARLNHVMIRMGALCEEAIATVTAALETGDRTLCDRVAQTEREIDQQERDVEALCLKLLIQQQPVATDMRKVSAALKMVTDMERIGDQSADIAEIMGYLTLPVPEACPEVIRMGHATFGMVRESVNAFVAGDVELAHWVVGADDVVDGLFQQVKEQLIRRVGSHPDEGEFVLDLLMIAKYFERIGDHATNIAEWVIFSVTGVHKEVES